MGRPKTVTDQKLHETARRCFLEHGPNLSVSTIAAELGISDAAIIKRVGSKENLLRRCLFSESPTPWIKTLRAGPDASPIAEQLVLLLEAISKTVQDRVPTLIMIRLSGLKPVDIIGDDLRKAPPLLFRKELAKWLKRAYTMHGLKLESPGNVANLLLSAAESRAFLQWISHDALPKTDWSEVVETVLDSRLTVITSTH